MEPIFAGRGRVISGRLANRLKRTQIKIIEWSYWPYIHAELFLEYSIRMRLLAYVWAAETTAS